MTISIVLINSVSGISPKLKKSYGFERMLNGFSI
jgi:hypothetical protein